MKKLSAILLLLFAFAVSGFAQQVHNIVDFGAKGDGITLNTRSIQSAINQAAVKGGVVRIPKGTFVCGTIYLKSGVTLQLDEGAVLMGSTNPFDYVKDPYCRWTAFVFAVKQHDIAITGKGTIDGRGWQVANNMVDYIHKGIVSDPLKYDRPNESIRPENIHFRECENIVIRDITLKDPASWNQQYDQCRNLVIEGITVDSKSYWNNDGVDIVDCSDVVVRNCVMDAADDVFCLKSHSVDGVCENVLIEDCTGRSSANGIKIGTMTRGTFRHIRFKNITIKDTYRSAVTIACVDGGHVEDIEVDGLRAYHTGNPIFLRFSERRTGKGDPCLKDIRIKNMYAEVPFDKPDAGYNYEGPVEDLPRNISPSGIVGTPGHRIDGVLLENVEIHYPGRADSTYAYCGTKDADLASIAERGTQYPEFSMFKELPAWGFYIRHADNVEFKNVKLVLEDKDYRPAIVADDVTKSTLKADIKAPEKRNMKTVKAKTVSSQSAETSLPVVEGKQYNASLFGIKSNGTTDNTASIQYAVDHIASQGGGTLVFYVGRYLTGQLQMRSNVQLLLNEGAILVESDNPNDFPDKVFFKGESTKILGLGGIERHLDIQMSQQPLAIEKTVVQYRR